MSGAAAIDLNVDFGESDHKQLSADELAILASVSSINLSCGVHAGSIPLIRSALASAGAAGVAVGAHPSYDDRRNFGRVEAGVPAEVIEPLVLAQLVSLLALARETGVRIRYVKAHGALYHRTSGDAEAAAALCRAARSAGPDPLPILGPRGSVIEKAAKKAKLGFFAEAFLDRGYRPDGTLVPRGEKGAMIMNSAESAARAVAIARGDGIRAVDGSPLRIAADSLCIHGDSGSALNQLRAVRLALQDAGVRVQPFAP